jgi:hypothetical protein
MKTNSARGRSECWRVSATVHSLDSQRVKVSKRQADVSVCSRFIGLVIRAIRPLILFPAIAFADQLSNHNEEHTAVQAAVSDFHRQGCLLTQTTRSGQYERHSTADASAQNIIGKVLTTRCVSWHDKPAVISHLLTWRHADKRTDGTVLPLSEVAGYELEHNGMVQAVGLVTEHTVDNPDSGSNRYRIATRDSLGRVGPFSSYVTLQR